MARARSWPGPGHPRSSPRSGVHARQEARGLSEGSPLIALSKTDNTRTAGGEEVEVRRRDALLWRAVQRGGQLLAEVPKGTPGKKPVELKAPEHLQFPSTRKAAAEQAGITPRQAKTALRVAAVHGRSP